MAIGKRAIVRVNLTAGRIPSAGNAFSEELAAPRCYTVAVVFLPKVDLDGVGGDRWRIAKDSTGLIQKMIIVQLSEVFVT
ncbi:hypothetical protein QUB68_16655 [Microcoleus sp. A006_D1]|uniref:hypothetical protein n=1 Tax=Microcoleus sp. A006_D1 TaxID=3055267 RepID=UPI002FD6143D